MLIFSVFGSFFFLGEILSTKSFSPSIIEPPQSHGACPVGCFKCYNSYPTGALTTHKPFRANLCIAYLTIEYKGAIPLEVHPLIGNWLFGCDLCQSIYPFNVRSQPTEESDFQRAIAGDTIALSEALAYTDESFAERFAGSPVKRAGRESFVRNACVVAGNVRDVSLIPQLRELTTYNDSLIVREHAIWTLEQIEKTSQ